MAVSKANMSVLTLDQLEIVETLEDVFVGDINAEDCSELDVFDDLSEAYYTLGDFYMTDQLITESIKAKERAVMLELSACELIEKTGSHNNETVNKL